VQQFDPLATQEWLIGFDTPKVPHGGSQPSAFGPKPVVHTPADARTVSLLDVQMDAPSPASVPKYTDRDLERLKAMMHGQALKEQELLKAELSNVDAQWKQEIERRKVRDILS